jgi:hypothetical protein
MRMAQDNLYQIDVPGRKRVQRCQGNTFIYAASHRWNGHQVEFNGSNSLGRYGTSRANEKGVDQLENQAHCET